MSTALSFAEVVMRFSVPVLLLGLIVFVASAGCAPTIYGPVPDEMDASTYSTLQEQAAANAGCEQEEMKYIEQLDRSRHLFEGCDGLLEMDLEVRSDGGHILHVLISPVERFIHEVDCPRDQVVRSQRQDVRTRIVEGCGHAAIYMVSCAPTSCSWVLNSLRTDDEIVVE